MTLRDGTYIRYILTGFADIPNWPDYEVTYAPDVEPSPAAFAASAEMGEPFDRTDMTPVYSCCCCCPRGHAAITMKMPQRTIVMEPKDATVNVPQLTVAVDNASKAVSNISQGRAEQSGNQSPESFYVALFVCLPVSGRQSHDCLYDRARVDDERLQYPRLQLHGDAVRSGSGIRSEREDATPSHPPPTAGGTHVPMSSSRRMKMLAFKHLAKRQ